MTADGMGEIPLTRVLQRLGMTRLQGYDAILRGDLQGRQLLNGRWVVSILSVDALEAKRQEGAASEIRGNQTCPRKTT
jgi:hypothetical protein